MIQLTPEQVIELDKHITFHVIRWWKKYGYDRDWRSQYWRDCKSYLWVQALKALNSRWNGICKPISFLKLSLKVWPSQFCKFEMKWYAQAGRLQPPKSVPLHVKVKHPLIGKDIFLNKILVSNENK